MRSPVLCASVLLLAVLSKHRGAEGKYQRLADAVGTPCNQNLTSAKLDILVFVDVTSGTWHQRSAYMSLLHRQLSALHLLNSTDTGSCVRLYYFSSSYVYGYNATASYPDLFKQECLNYTTLSEALYNTSSYYSGNSGVYLYYAIKTASSIFAASPVAGKNQLAIFAVGNNMYDSIDTANLYANDLKNSGAGIMTISNADDSSSRIEVANVATPGQSFHIAERNLDANVYSSLTYFNCRCANGTKQFSVYNPATNHVDYYADCLTVQTTPKVSYFAEKDCEAQGGSLAAMTSAEKFTFIHQEIASRQLNLTDTPEYNVGLHRQQKDNSLVWYYYEKETIPLGNYANWAPNASNNSNSSYCGFVRLFGDGGQRFGMDLGSCNKKSPYVCQISA